MHLIALLIGLVIERFATRFFHWRRMRWLEGMIDGGFRQAERLGNWPAIIPVIVLAVLLVLPVVAIMFSLGETLPVRYNPMGTNITTSTVVPIHFNS